MRPSDSSQIFDFTRSARRAMARSLAYFAGDTSPAPPILCA
jgi:hypothetical protein